MERYKAGEWEQMRGTYLPIQAKVALCSVWWMQSCSPVSLFAFSLINATTELCDASDITIAKVYFIPADSKSSDCSNSQIWAPSPGTIYPNTRKMAFCTAAASLWLPRANIATRRRLCRRTALAKTYMFEAFILTENSSALCQVEWSLHYLLQVSATSKQQLSTRVHLGVAVSIRWINYTTNAVLIVREFYRNLLKWW